MILTLGASLWRGPPGILCSFSYACCLSRSSLSSIWRLWIASLSRFFRTLLLYLSYQAGSLFFSSRRDFTRRSVATDAATYGLIDVFREAPGSFSFFTTIDLGGVLSDGFEMIGATTTDDSPCC